VNLRPHAPQQPGGGTVVVRTCRRGWRYLVIAILLAGCGVQARAVAGGPRPGTAHARVWFESVQMISARAGWALVAAVNPTQGNGAPVLAARTADGGRIWTATGPAAIAGLTGEPIVLQAVSASRAWLAAVVPAGRGRHVTDVFGTTNGGASWSRSAPVRQGGPKAMAFADPVHGWLLEDLGEAMNQDWIALYRSADGGRRWSLIAHTVAGPQGGTSSSGLPTACDKAGVTFSSPRTGWITGDCASGREVLVTHDAGARWAPQPLPMPAAACTQDGCVIAPPQFAGRTGFLTVWRPPAAAELLVSRDEGRSWQARRLPAGAGPYPLVTFFGAGRGIAVPGETQGAIGRDFYVTADGGGRWTAVRQGMQFWPAGTGAEFVSVSDGFAWIPSGDLTSGPAPDMYVTTNSGRTWTAIAPRLAAA
jgi:photosystem II stability/assembly factor-like uncharacterized protein